MKLPNPERASIPFEKLEGYALSTDRPRGRHKAVVFRAALDIGPAEANELRAALRNALQERDARPTKRTDYGQNYQLDLEMTRNDKTATIRSIWSMRNGEDFPRLVTCYIP